MIETAAPFPAGTVGYITAGTARYFQFFDSLEATQVPKGTVLRRALGCNPAKNSNMLVQQMLGDWLWLQGDDHRWQPDLLIRLLSHNVDAVVPLVARWGPPFHPVIYKEFDPKAGKTLVYTWNEIQVLRDAGQTLVPVAAAGSAGLLVRRHVLEALVAHHGDPIFRVGGTGPDEIAEDLCMTAAIAALGFDMLCDLTAFMGHTTSATVEPVVLPDGRLAITADIHGGRLLAYTTERSH